MKKICKNCGKEYEAYDKVRHAHNNGGKYKRPSNSITCSKKCSGEWLYKRMKLKKCDLCKRKLGKKTITWCLVFYNLKSLIICEECDFSVNEQIIDNLTYFWENK